MRGSPVVSVSNYPPHLSREDVQAQISRLDSIHAANSQVLGDAFKRLLAIGAGHAAVITACIAGFDALVDRSVLTGGLLPDAIDILRKFALTVSALGLFLTFWAIGNNYGEVQKEARRHAVKVATTLREKRLLLSLSQDVLNRDPKSYLLAGVGGFACLCAIFGLASLAGIAGLVTTMAAIVGG
ncbi:hypothetical protein [Ensifer adhaerens]|uniref:hypothetical protein n=1 Tax=Ensifer adhaerens TaxID=106592 RepID=UPI000FDA5938|nr:hypothetical protein [Ensifer adhaerens]MDF8354702.1 hypothetical protein [Ensifer adhaerens]THA68852.1 hypothetical protein E5176_02985 [Ensifer adhaerens]